MKGDFTRDTFDPHHHYTRVLMQQGRVQLDADWNEQAAIHLHYLQALARYLIGPHGVLANDDGTEGTGFKIAQLKDGDKVVSHDFAFQRGHYYVDGILCENDSDTAHYTDQPDYPLAKDPNRDNAPKLDDGTFLVYLDVWEHHITFLDDDDIREKALGGPDTATRARVVWQVRTSHKRPDNTDLPGGFTKVDAAKLWPDWVKQWQPPQRGLLQAMVKPLADDQANPCITPPQSGYRGEENQLYRVEIHTGGTPHDATFKWSRDNGSVAAEWKDTQGNDLIVGSARGFAAGQWVELIDETRELRGERGTLVQLAKVEGQTLTIDPHSKKGSTELETTYVHPKVRRWDQKETDDIKFSADDNAIPVTEDSPIDLENGIQIQFKKSSPDNQYRTGDYWLIPARTATGNIEWPLDKDTQGKPVPAFLAPRGIDHHYAPLCIISLAGVNVTIGDDLRRRLKPLLTF